VVVVDHHDSYTWNLVHLLAGVTGAMPEVVQHDATTAAHVLSFDAVVLSPGPGRPDNAEDFDVGRAVLTDGRVPTLGVCLGMQGLVTAYGGRVERVEPAHGEVAEVTHDGTGVFRDLPPSFKVVRYHSLAATRVPDELAVTARSGDGVVMGVRHRSRPLHGVQFHPESILSEHGARLVATFLEAP
jgi:anthranilate synthase component 2/para-aminobenzoate synthetase